MPYFPQAREAEKVEANRQNMLRMKAEADARREKEEKVAALKADEEKRAAARKEAMENTKKMKAEKGKKPRASKDE